MKAIGFQYYQAGVYGVSYYGCFCYEDFEKYIAEKLNNTSTYQIINIIDSVECNLGKNEGFVKFRI
jgi:hypothetical protein